MRAAHLILSAILTMQGEAAPAFSTHCDTIDNLCETVMSIFEKLGYRDRTVLGMRLGFNPHKGFAPTNNFSELLECALVWASNWLFFASS